MPFAELLKVSGRQAAVGTHWHAEFTGMQDVKMADVGLLVPQLPGPLRAAIAVESKRHVRGTVGADPLAAVRFQRRLSPAATPLMYMCNGDHNGVCHYIGTAYGQQKFVNPALSGHLQARCCNSAASLLSITVMFILDLACHP